MASFLDKNISGAMQSGTDLINTLMGLKKLRWDFALNKAQMEHEETEKQREESWKKYLIDYNISEQKRQYDYNIERQKQQFDYQLAQQKLAYEERLKQGEQSDRLRFSMSNAREREMMPASFVIGLLRRQGDDETADWLEKSGMKRLTNNQVGMALGVTDIKNQKAMVANLILSRKPEDMSFDEYLDTLAPEEKDILLTFYGMKKPVDPNRINEIPDDFFLEDPFNGMLGKDANGNWKLK